MAEDEAGAGAEPPLLPWLVPVEGGPLPPRGGAWRRGGAAAGLLLLAAAGGYALLSIGEGRRPETAAPAPAANPADAELVDAIGRSVDRRGEPSHARPPPAPRRPPPAGERAARSPAGERPERTAAPPAPQPFVGGGNKRGRESVEAAHASRAARTPARLHLLSGPVVQIGAYSTRARAEFAWRACAAGAGAGRLAHWIEPVRLPGRTLYRLRVQAVAAARPAGRVRVHRS